MCRAKLHSSATALLIALLLVGCGLTEPDAMRVDLSLSGSAASETEPIRITVTGINVGTRPIEVDSHGCPQLFEVVSLGERRLVGPETVACQLILLSPTTLEPGDSIRFEYDWAGRGVGRESGTLPFGTYRLRGWVRIMPSHRVFSDYVAVEVGP